MSYKDQWKYDELKSIRKGTWSCHPKRKHRQLLRNAPPASVAWTISPRGGCRAGGPRWSAAVRDRVEAHIDYEVNLMAETEIKVILENLEAQNVAIAEIHKLIVDVRDKIMGEA